MNNFFIKKLAFVVLAFSFFLPTPSYAALFLNNENISSGKTVAENVYLVGANPSIDGTIEGDLISAGGNVNFNGKVTKDAYLLGGTVILNGDIGEDAQLIGGNIIMNGSISEDLRIAGGNAMINGKVGGEVVVAGGELQIGPNAQIMGDLVAAGGKVTISPGAKIMGQQKIYQDQSVKKPQITNPFQQFSTFQFYLNIFFTLLNLSVVGLLLYLLFKKPMRFLVDEALRNEKIWENLGLGFMVLFLSPIVVALSFITGVGVLLGFILLFLYGLLILMSLVYADIIFAGLLLRIFNKKEHKYELNWKWVLLGIITLHLICLIPIIGWITGLVFLMYAMGTALRVKFLWSKSFDMNFDKR